MFIAEVPEDQEPRVQIVLNAPDADAFQADPIVEVVSPFADTHYGTREMIVRDPGRPAVDPASPGRESMADEQAAAPDSTAVRVALWRAMHVRVDPAPHMLEDEVGLRLAAGRRWLGCPALDTFAQRRPEAAARLRVFEVDRPVPQEWKRERLTGLSYGVPGWLRLVPVDFEAGGSWREQVSAAGFEAGRPAVVASTGVSMYLSKDANAATLRQLAALAPAPRWP